MKNWILARERVFSYQLRVIYSTMPSREYARN